MNTPSPWKQPPKNAPRRAPSPVMWLVIVAVLTAALIVFLMFRYPQALDGEDARMEMVYRVLLLAFLVSALGVRWRARPGDALKHIATWLLIGAVIFLGYSFRHEFFSLKDRLAAELLPHRGLVEGQAVTFTARTGGHFVIEAKVDGVNIRFLVDTGASDVMLSPADARRLGFDLSALSFTRPYRTANGSVMGAPVRLNSIAVGPIVVENVRASVNGAEMNESLLGMSFLERLSSFEVSGDRLTMRP